MQKQKSTSQQIKQIIKLSIANIWRNKFLSTATVFVIAIILFILNIILGINNITQTSLQILNEKVDIKAYIKETATEDKISVLINELNSKNEIKEITYITKKDALNKIEILHPDITSTFTKYGLDNPLPRSLNIITKKPSDHKTITTFLKQDNLKNILSSVNSASDNDSILNSVSNNLEKITNFTNQIIFWVVLVFIIGGILIITNSIQITIFNRKSEIDIMKFLGGSHTIIKMPFILEAIIYGLISIIISILMLRIATTNIEINLANYYNSQQFTTIIIREIIALVLIATISATIAVHKQLQKKI